MKLHFSPVLPQDAEFLFQLNKELIDRYEDTSAIDYHRILMWVKKNIDHQIPFFHRVMADGELAGFYCLSPSQEKWELDSLFVLPKFQNQGIGTAVLEHCIGKCEGNLFLYVFRKNTGAFRLYERLGFRITKEVGTTRFIMEYEKQGC